MHTNFPLPRGFVSLALSKNPECGSVPKPHRRPATFHLVKETIPAGNVAQATARSMISDSSQRHNE